MTLLLWVWLLSEWLIACVGSCLVGVSSKSSLGAWWQEWYSKAVKCGSSTGCMVQKLRSKHGRWLLAELC